MEKNSQPRLSFLKSPITILFSIAIAIVLGVLGSKGDINVEASQRTIYDWVNLFVTLFTPLGGMYLNMLRMTVYPILIAAIISSIAGLVKAPEIGRFLSRMLICFGAMLLFTALLGTTAGIVGKPGAGLSEEAKATLGKSIEKSEYKADIEISLSEKQVPQEKSNFVDFFVNIVPRNIFKSLVDELALQLVIFSIFFGIAAGMIQGEKSDFIVAVFEGLFKAFQTIISWLMYLLPIGLIFLIAGQITSSQKFFELLSAMIRFIVLFYIAGMVTLVINTVIIWRRSKEKLGLVLKELLDPIIIALATRSSFATLPSAMKALDQKLGFFESTTKLYIPLGITLGRFGNILYFALAAMFVSQLYASSMTIGGLFIVIIGSIFAGTATAGATGLSTLALMSIVLEPLGLPVEAVLILFMTIDTIIDPLRTLLIVHTNMAVNALVAGKVTKGDQRREIRNENDPIRTSFIDKIRDKDEIVLAIRKKDIPLFHYQTNDDEFVGFDIDLAKKVADEFEVKLRIDNSAETETDIINMLVSHKADFAISRLKKKTSIEEQICATKPYLTFHRALLVNKDMTRGRNIKTTITTHVGSVAVTKESDLLVPALQLFPEAEIKEYADYDDMAKAVAKDEKLIAYGCEVDFYLALKKLPSQQKEILSVFAFRNSEESYIVALPKSYSSSVYIFNKVIEKNEMSIDPNGSLLSMPLPSR